MVILKNSAKAILCFGDSNTWGFNPKSEKRYPRSVRWPYVLQKLLGDKYEVISEGMIGRTLASEDLKRPYYNGSRFIQGLVKSHDPLDFIIIMLGTNEIKDRYNLNAFGIAKNLKKIINLIRDKKLDLEKNPKIIIICPPAPIEPTVGKTRLDMGSAPKVFKSLPLLYKKIALEYGCIFLNAGEYISPGKFDGYHFDSGAHLKLAKVVAEKIINNKK